MKIDRTVKISCIIVLVSTMLFIIISSIITVILLCVIWYAYKNPCMYRGNPPAMQEVLRFTTCPSGLLDGSTTDCKDLYINKTIADSTVTGGNLYKVEDGTAGLRGTLMTRAKREDAKNIFGGFRTFEDETHICAAYGEGIEPGSADARPTKAYLDGLCLAQAKRKNNCYKQAEATIMVDSRRKETKNIRDMCKYGNGVMCSYKA